MRPPFNGSYGINAGWRYASGAGHFAYDYDCPLGTQLYAISDGIILASYDGVPNDEDQRGDTDYTGEPSNWILLGLKWHGEFVSVLYQHLSPGHGKRAGMRVKEGSRIAKSGDSGNTSGPHLHFAAMRGKQNTASRYIYMSNDGNNSYVIYPPDKLWKGEENMDLSDHQLNDIADRVVDKLLHRKIFGDQAKKELKDVTVQDSYRRSYLGSDEPKEI